MELNKKTTISKIEIENLKALKGAHTFTPGGQSFFILGSNGKGKTTVGHTIVDIMMGKYPSEMTTTGADEGKIIFTLDDGSKIRVGFDPKHRPSLTVTTSDGDALGAPKDYLSRLLGAKGASFDVDKFITMAPKPRREMLEAILGVDLEAINDKEADAFDKRRDANAMVRDAESRVEPYDKSLLEEEEKSVSEAMTKLQKMQDHNRLHVEFERRRNDALTKEQELKKELADMIAHKNKINIEWEKMEDPHPTDGLQEYQAQIQGMEERNHRIIDAKRCHLEHENLKKHQDRAKSFDDAVAEARAEKEAILKATPLPGELTWGEDGQILLGGLPFEEKQVSTSDRVIAGIQIAEKLMGELRFLHFEGSVLDRDNAEKVMLWAEANDMQLACERVSWDEAEIELQVFDYTKENKS